MASERGSGTSELMSFSYALETLKRNGGNILLVGEETADAHTTICHQLLGDTGTDSRYRLFITAGREHVTGPGHADSTTARTIDYSELGFTEKPAGTDESSNSSLETLGIEIGDAIDTFDDTADGLEESELRVCLDSIMPLLETHSPETVFRLLHMTTSHVVHVHGMGHYHLPLERDHDVVTLFEPLFDAIIEVRTRGGSPEQQWQLREQSTTTDWIPFERRQ